MTFEGLLPIHFWLSVAMASAGFAAMALRKGSSPHRLAGNLFFAGMVILTATGALLIALRPESAIQGWVAMASVYLVLTGWATVRRRQAGAGPWTKAGAALGALIVVSGAAIVAQELAQGADSTGTLLITGLVFWFTVLDLTVILR